MTNLRSWLKRRPVPVKVRVDDRVLAVPDSTHKWSDLEGTIGAFQWTKLEALDAEGNVLRATLDDEELSTEEVDAKDAKGRLGEIAQIAHELRECVRCVQDGQSKTWSTVVQAAYDLTSKLAETNARLERDLAVARNEAARLEAELAAVGQQAGGDVASTLLQGMMRGKADAEKTNGAPKPEAKPNG